MTDAFNIVIRQTNKVEKVFHWILSQLTITSNCWRNLFEMLVWSLAPLVIKFSEINIQSKVIVKDELVIYIQKILHHHLVHGYTTCKISPRGPPWKSTLFQQGLLSIHRCCCFFQRKAWLQESVIFKFNSCGLQASFFQLDAIF